MATQGTIPATPPPTLAVRVYEAAFGEGAPWEDLLGMTELPPEAISDNRGDHAAPVDFSHLLSWGFCFGAAYAVARLENPLGCENTWWPRAREAADKASRWHMTVGGRPEDES
jgi:hypothetical protein